MTNIPRDTDIATNAVISMLAKLPAEYVMLIEQFVRFLYEQFQRKSEVQATPTTGMTYPLVTVPADSLGMWTNLLPRGYEGNALDDTEALYNEVI